MHIVLVISSLNRGGAERVCSVMANYWVEQRRAVSVVTLADTAEDGYRLHPEVQRIAIGGVKNSGNPLAAIFNELRRVRSLRAVAKHLRPDVVISFLTECNIRALCALFATRVPLIVSERNDPAQLPVGAIRERLRTWLYPHASAVVVQTARVRDEMQCKLPKGRFAVIPNPVPDTDPDRGQDRMRLRELVGLQADAKVVVAMGRLEVQKGFDMLVRAFATLANQHTVWHLVVLGEGSARKGLEAQAARLGLADRVHLPGHVRNARQCLAEADLFVLSSRFEGFPNALLEAMACGLPVVSFNCPSGPGEIIRNGYDGVLVEARNVKVLGSVMSELMDSPVRRGELGNNARQVLERFSLDRIMALWDQLLVNAVTHREREAC